MVAALGIACSRIASPRGWASPVEGEDVLLVSHRDKLYSLDPDTLIDTQLFPPQPNDDDIDAEALYGDPAANVPLLYGGSVNPGNVASFAAQVCVHGALVGGASLQAGQFLDIGRIMKQAKG